MQYIAIAHKNIRLSLGQYVKLIKGVKAAPPGTRYKETLTTWYPGTREDILRQFGQMVTDRINRHQDIPAATDDAELLRLQRAHLISECAWCGQSLGRYEPKHNRFCEASCKRSYYS